MSKIGFTAFFTAAVLLVFAPKTEAAVIRDIAFPTNPEAINELTDNFGEPRGSGRTHEGIDMIGPKMTPLYAAVDGTVTYLPLPEPSWGYHLVITDADGYEYHYIHINNDTPGTDDGNGGTEHAFAPGIRRGARVSRGQLVAYMGDSGNAEWVTSHLHFEIRKNDIAINPYESLLAALGNGGAGNTSTEPSDYAERLAFDTPDINADKNLTRVPDAPCESGSLIKGESSSAVYYCGADGKRYGFPNERVYFSWYEDFDEVVELTDAELASVPLGGNVTYRPGVRMVKLESIPNVYLVEPGGVLRWIQSPSLAVQLYGAEWAKNVHDLSDALFTNYRLGEPISSLAF